MQLSNKNKVLFLGILLLLFACYTLAINKTIQLKESEDQLTGKVALFSNIPKQLSLLSQKEKYYDSILHKMDLEDTSIQNNLLRILNEQAKKNDVTVLDFNEPHSYSMGENSLQTFSFTIKGKFTNTLRVIHELEVKRNFGEIVHIAYEKEKSYRTNNYGLSATIFIQHTE